MESAAEITSVTDDDAAGNGNSEIAQPLHLQRLESAVRLDTFLNQFDTVFAENLSECGDESTSTDTDVDESTVADSNNRKIGGIVATKQDLRSDKSMLYNFTRVKRGRKWLKSLLLSDSSEEDQEITEDDLKRMLKIHLLNRKHQAKFKTDKDLKQYQYYSAGLLSNHDRFPEHQKSIIGNSRKAKEKKLEQKIKAKLKRIKKKEKKRQDIQESVLNQRDFTDDLQLANLLASLCEESGTGYGGIDGQRSTNPLPTPKSRKKSAAVTEASLANKRRKLWVTLAKKEIPKAQKHMVAVRKEIVTNCKKMAQACQKEIRKTAIQFQKSLKETPGRARRLTREMMLYWKRYEKVEKEMRKRAEKEAQEQLKMDIELREAKRQQRKLNFLITQTELYAHFMSRKLGRVGGQDATQERILKQLIDEPLPRGLDDDYDGEEAKAQALRNARIAYESQQSKAKIFDSGTFPLKRHQDGFGDDFRLTDPSISTEQDRPQPGIFKGKLKVYQLKGMNWLANLYDQGINGILADEMGLGKTVQSIAFLAHIAESQDIWGPFLIIAPASTLHNWQQEFSRFLPKLKVLPYWGNTSDRKILRKFWNHKDLHTEDASFHVLITSYQLVVQDVKYFQRIKWQYMVLDEAQAIKSSTSVRWKILLGFNCRNRLLLTGTPIQNSMAELWALLHFIMPTLFDSHDEFNEWFSKEIEGHAENKSFIDEKHLSRLHMILKPFMLRRIKKDVENELSDKIEILLYCHLTTRQKRLYSGLKQKISIDDLLHSASGGGSASSASQASQSATSSLMNLVMQFRKVCNHPELFERREIRSPLIQRPHAYAMPKLIFREGILSHSLPSRQRLLGNLFNIYEPENVNKSIFTEDGSTTRCFGFLRFLGLSPAELLGVLLFGYVYRWLLACREMDKNFVAHHRHVWSDDQSISRHMGSESLLLDSARLMSAPSLRSSPCLRSLVFTSYTSTVYVHGDVTLHCMPETREHRKMRAQKMVRSTAGTQLPLIKAPSTHPVTGMGSPAGSSHPKSPTLKPSLILKQNPVNQLEDVLVPELRHRERPAQILRCQPVEMPLFVTGSCPKAIATHRDLHCSDRSAAYWSVRYLHGRQLEGTDVWQHGRPELADDFRFRRTFFRPVTSGGVVGTRPHHGWSGLVIPDKETLVTDSGKLNVLDDLLGQLKTQGHRVLIYSQMTRMIDLLEEYMWHRKHTYMRLDGSSKISERRDMVADFQSRSDIFVFLLSTRAGGLGINLTAADTVVFYDSDWNPTVDQQAMDRAHRLGQTKQVTVYRLICKGTIEERILQRAREKSEIQRMVISGGQFKPDTLKPKEVVSLLLDDDELERKFRQRQAEKKLLEDQFKDRSEKKRKRDSEKKIRSSKKMRVEENVTIPANQDSESVLSLDSVPPSPSPSEKSFSSTPLAQDDTSNEGSLIVDDGAPLMSTGIITTTATTISSSLLPLSIGTSPSNQPGSSSSSTAVKRSSKLNRSTGRSRGRPKGSCKRSISGRSQRRSSLGGAQVAGTQVGASAVAFAAAYGYGVSTATATTTTTIGTSSGTLQVRPSTQAVGAPPVRGHGVRMRGPINQCPTTRHPFKGATSGTSGGDSTSVTAQIKGMGFYVQNNPTT